MIPFYSSVVVHRMSIPDDGFGVIFRFYCYVQRYCEHFLCISGAYTFSKAVVLKLHPGTVHSSLSPFQGVTEQNYFHDTKTSFSFFVILSQAYSVFHRLYSMWWCHCSDYQYITHINKKALWGPQLFLRV